MDDIMNAIADVAKDNEEGEEIRCTARVYRADELSEEQRRKYEEFAVNGVYSENYESKEQMKSKRKTKNMKKKVPLEESEEPMGAAAFVDDGEFFVPLFVEDGRQCQLRNLLEIKKSFHTNKKRARIFKEDEPKK